MGHGIDIKGECKHKKKWENCSDCSRVIFPSDEVIENGKTYRLVNTCDGLYFSYNWFIFCFFWSVGEHMHNKKGREIVSHINRALKEIYTFGIPIIKPGKNWNVSWGNDHTVQERLGIFVYHLNRFHVIASHCPDAIFTSDCCDENDDFCSTTYEATKKKYEDLVRKELNLQPRKHTQELTYAEVVKKSLVLF